MKHLRFYLTYWHHIVMLFGFGGRDYWISSPPARLPLAQEYDHLQIKGRGTKESAVF